MVSKRKAVVVLLGMMGEAVQIWATAVMRSAWLARAGQQPEPAGNREGHVIKRDVTMWLQ